MSLYIRFLRPLGQLLTESGIALAVRPRPAGGLEIDASFPEAQAAADRLPGPARSPQYALSG